MYATDAAQWDVQAPLPAGTEEACLVKLCALDFQQERPPLLPADGLPLA